MALHEAELAGADVVVPYDRRRVEQAPTVQAGRNLSVEEEDSLFHYEGVPIEGITPSVEHLGAALSAGEDRT